MSCDTHAERGKLSLLMHRLSRHLGPREKALISGGFFLAVVAVILIAGQFIGSDALSIDLAAANQAPNTEHLFGTDWIGRDMLTRTLVGLNLSIKIGVLCSAISGVLALILGVMGPLIGGKLDSFVGWLVDLVMSIPHTILIILISVAFGGGFKGVVIGVAFTHWTSLTRVLRAEVLSLKEREFIKASRQFGKSALYRALHHIVPLVLPQLIVGTILVFPHAILHEASITFLGFGLPPHEPAIGVILAEAMRYLVSGQWWLAFFPGLALIAVSLMVSSVGHSLERIINPASAYTLHEAGDHDE